jgi:hypothetical protein
MEGNRVSTVAQKPWFNSRLDRPVIVLRNVGRRSCGVILHGSHLAVVLSAAYGRNQRRRRPGARRIDFKETVAPTFEEVNHRTQAGLKWRFSLICSGMP